jgi:Ca2+-binding RTX toxin-like protein
MSQEYAHASLDMEAWLERAGTLGFEASYSERSDLQGFSDAVLMGTAGRDVLTLNAGGDIAAGLGGRDRIRGNTGDDRIFGHAGSDSLTGGAGDDTLAGGAGSDMLHGGSGTNVLTGGLGSDVFVFTDARHNRSAALRDTITDFNNAYDRIDLSGLAVGLSFDPAARSFSGAGGEVIFRPSKGLLLVDLDGDARADFGLILSGDVRLTADALIL